MPQKSPNCPWRESAKGGKPEATRARTILSPKVFQPVPIRSMRSKLFQNGHSFRKWLLIGPVQIQQSTWVQSVSVQMPGAL